MFGIQCLDSYTFHVTFRYKATNERTPVISKFSVCIACLSHCFLFLSFYSTQCSYKFYTQNVIGPICLLFSKLFIRFFCVSNLEQIELLSYSHIACIFLFNFLHYMKIQFPIGFIKLKTKIHFRCVLVLNMNSFTLSRNSVCYEPFHVLSN